MRTRFTHAALLAVSLATLSGTATAVTLVTVNIPVDVDNLDPSIASVSCGCWLRGPGSGGIEGPMLSPVAGSTVGTVARGSFHGTLTSALGDGTAPVEAFLRAAEVVCMLNLRTAAGPEFQPGSSTVPYTTGPAAPRPGTKFRAKIVIPLTPGGRL